MNEKILKERVLAEIERSEEALAAASTLFKDELYSDSISRSYYAILHAAKAILLTINIEPQSHSGATSMFGLHFVKTGLIEDKYSKIFSKAREEREIGDYGVTRKFTKEETEERMIEAKEFVERIKKCYRIENFLI